MESLSATSTIATEGSHHEETSTSQSTTSLNDGRLRTSQSCPLLRTAFRTFARAADEEKQANRRHSAANTGAPVISLQQSIQRDVIEAETVDELDALGEIQFPCANGSWHRGWHFHALLVMERLRCPLKIYDRFLLNLVVKLSERGHSSSSLLSVSAETCSTVSDYGCQTRAEASRPRTTLCVTSQAHHLDGSDAHAKHFRNHRLDLLSGTAHLPGEATFRLLISSAL